MRKLCLLVVLFFTFIIFTGGCGASNEAQGTTTVAATTEERKLTTPDEAVEWYLTTIPAPAAMQGQHFVYSYRILGTEESDNHVTVFAHILFKWISESGETLSGRAGLDSITFKNENHTYEYENFKSYDAQQIPDASEIPQKVKDAIKGAAYFDEMHREVEQDIADYLEASGQR